jgi:hypothetical protein
MIVGNASDVPNPTPVRWGESWAVDKYFEVLIGKKTDPFCFSVIPGPDSVGDLCYRPDFGAQYFDVGGPSRAIRFDFNSKTVVGNVTSEILHKDTDFWILNKFPWYALGVEQCICSKVREGGSAQNPNGAVMYPVNPDWVKAMYYIGRENIGVEYTGLTLTLDHWAFGPHHVWAEPTTGEVVRMWQPFNGLQVFPPGSYKEGKQDESLFEAPPKQCKKGGATFRVKCDDDGYNIETSKVDEVKLTDREKGRAQKLTPDEEYRGHDFTDMSTTLNGWLENGNADTRPCDDWNVDELRQLQAMLYLVRESSLDDIYASVEDKRRMRKDFKDIEADWMALSVLLADVEEDHKAHKILRDGHCHEAVMWYVHHLTEEVKDLLAVSGVVLPLLSMDRHPKPTGQDDSATHIAYNVYEEQVTCSSCHAQYVPGM